MTRPARRRTVSKSERIRIVRRCVRALRGFMETDVYERAWAHELRTGGRYDASYRDFCRELRKKLGEGLAVVEKQIVGRIRGRR